MGFTARCGSMLYKGAGGDVEDFQQRNRDDPRGQELNRQRAFLLGSKNGGEEASLIGEISEAAEEGGRLDFV
jgi:hypothetical protein